MRRTHAAIAALVAVLAIAASACASEGESSPESAPPAATEQAFQGSTTTTTGAAETETEPEVEPITTAERRWLRQATGYRERLERGIARAGPVTHSSMRREASLYARCAPVLERAGDPGRLEPAQKLASRACERLERAADALEQAIAATDAGGSVVVGTSEEELFERSFGRAVEAAGRGLYDLQRAIDRAEEIERSVGP